MADFSTWSHDNLVAFAQQSAEKLATFDAIKADADTYRFIIRFERLKITSDLGHALLISEFDSNDDFDAAVKETMANHMVRRAA